MKKQHLITLALAIFFVGISLQGVHAQTSISGDEICGASTSTECTLANAKTVITNFIKLVIEIGSVLLTLFIMYRIVIAWYAKVQGNAMAIKQAGKDIGNAILGFFIVVAVFGGFFLAILKFLGAQEWTTTLIRLISDAFIPHAYAQTGELLPNPLGTNSLYDFILIIVRVAIRWFVYPALVGMWVWSGFSFVLAQGNPEKIMKARNWLMWAVISTVIVFMTEGFLFALRGTVQTILPN
ncbi:MAG: hypothetical protein WCT07_02465 [Candidatus Paceibacterota bacterium]